MFEWFDHFLHYVIPDFLVEVFAALPFVIPVCIIYWFIRRAWHKKRLGADFAEDRRKCRLNEILRLLLIAWIAAVFLLCFIPSDLTRNFWVMLSRGYWNQRETPFGYLLFMLLRKIFPKLIENCQRTIKVKKKST